MAIDATKVLAGAPDQLVTGAILSAPLSVSVPSDTQMYGDTFTGFKDSGYVSEEGLTMSLSKSYELIKDWSRAVVKRILNEFDGTIKYTHLELSEFSLKDTFGDDHVSVTPATSSAGTRYKVEIGAHDLPTKRYVFKMKDGPAKVRILVPHGVPTELEDTTFSRGDAIKLGVTLGCQPDAHGNSIYIFLDDGIKTA
ncbi:MAG: hypothetical protein Q4B08_07630 [Propionibacteriaceae bacterium]|nr:hypothetical protein [Propionibacteriaceae bacterium]